MLLIVEMRYLRKWPKDNCVGGNIHVKGTRCSGRQITIKIDELD